MNNSKIKKSRNNSINYPKKSPTRTNDEQQIGKTSPKKVSE